MQKKSLKNLKYYYLSEGRRGEDKVFSTKFNNACNPYYFCLFFFFSGKPKLDIVILTSNPSVIEFEHEIYLFKYMILLFNNALFQPLLFSNKAIFDITCTFINLSQYDVIHHLRIIKVKIKCFLVKNQMTL